MSLITIYIFLFTVNITVATIASIIIIFYSTACIQGYIYIYKLFSHVSHLEKLEHKIFRLKPARKKISKSQTLEVKSFDL